MKKILISPLLIVLCLAPWACKRPLPTGPTPVPSPTPTAVVTPVCGFTPLAVAPMGVSAGDYVIQSQTEWSNVNGAGTTIPPVDFSNQMILEVSQTVAYDCTCSAKPPVITSVCAYPDHLEVVYQNGGQACPTPGAVSCNSVFIIPLQSLVIVPPSNLPVSWVSQ